MGTWVKDQNFKNAELSYFKTYTWIFLGQIWGQISAPSLFKNEHNLPKMMYFIPNFFVQHFDENFMKIGPKITKLQTLAL